MLLIFPLGASISIVVNPLFKSLILKPPQFNLLSGKMNSSSELTPDKE